MCVCYNLVYGPSPTMQDVVWSSHSLHIDEEGSVQLCKRLTIEIVSNYNKILNYYYNNYYNYKDTLL